MINKSRVSIIIPCYNSGATIDRTLNSVTSQSWKDIEIIVINDGSSDKITNDKLNQISRKKNIMLVNQSNLGLASARNSGISVANGDFILPLDADDWLEPDAISRMVLIAHEKGRNTVVYSDLRLHGEISGVKKAFCNPVEQLFSNQLPYCMLFPREILEEVGGYDKNFTFGFEDWELNIRLLQNGYDFCNAGGVLFNYWVSKKGMLKSKSLKQYVNIFASIEKKHHLIYSLPSTMKLFIKFRKSEAKRNLWVYFFYSIMLKVVSRRILSFLVSVYLRKKIR
jgi:glycosyltransferase involved in cell wall biosynthesis